MTQEYEYDVKATFDGKDVGASRPTPDPKEAGARYREIRDAVPLLGGEVELRRRPVGPWETIDRVPPR